MFCQCTQLKAGPRAYAPKSAKRGLAIACRSSVCPPFVTLVDCDHTGWKCWKLITPTISPKPSLFNVAKKQSIYSQGNMGKFGETRSRIERSDVPWRTKAAVSLKRVKIEEKLLWRAYRNSPTIFRAVPSPTPYALSRG